MEVETCGDSWKGVKSIPIPTYTPVVSVSFAGGPSTLRIDLSCSLSFSCLPPLPLQCRICSYFAHINLTV